MLKGGSRGRVLVDRYLLPLIKDGFFALHHLFIKRKVAVGIVAFRIIIIDIIINYFFILFIYICDKYLILYIIIYYIIVRQCYYQIGCVRSTVPWCFLAGLLLVKEYARVSHWI